MSQLLLTELVRNAQRMGPRLRLAVTLAEYEEIRAFLLKKDGRFFGRIQNIPLLIEDDPRDVPLIGEVAEG